MTHCPTFSLHMLENDLSIRIDNKKYQNLRLTTLHLSSKGFFNILPAVRKICNSIQTFKKKLENYN